MTLIRFVILMYSGDSITPNLLQSNDKKIETNSLQLSRIGIIHRTYPQPLSAFEKELNLEFTMSKKQADRISNQCL